MNKYASPSLAQSLKVVTFGTLPETLRAVLQPDCVLVDGFPAEESVDAVFVLPGASTDAAIAAMAKSDNLLAALIDLSAAAHPRADYCGSATHEGISRGLEVAAQLRQRRTLFAAIPHNEDRVGLTVLALAATRQKSIEPRLAPAVSQAIDYPLLAGLPEQRGLLENLAGAKLLRRKFYERLFACTECQSSRVVPREVCPSCGSSDLSEDSLVHHYQCGYQGPKSGFPTDENRMTCPKCDKVLRHYGVDYDTPGSVRVCQSCKKTAAEPEIVFLCLDCQSRTRGIDIASRDWFSYELTPIAEMAVAEGRLPRTGLQDLLGGLAGWRTPRDLALMIDLARRIGQRYKRPYSVVEIDVGASDIGLSTFGQIGASKLQRVLVDMISETIRESDFLATFDRKVILFLPETSHDNIRFLVTRLQGHIVQNLGDKAKIAIAMVPEDAIPILIQQMSK